jgi:hypothetical protein
LRQSGRGTVGGERGPGGKFVSDHAALPTDRTELERCSGELLVEGPPVGGWHGQQESGRIDFEQLPTTLDHGRSVTVGEEAEVADADKAGGQDVEQEAAEELGGFEREDFLHPAVAVILPGETHSPIFHLPQAMIGNGDAVGVAAVVWNSRL